MDFISTVIEKEEKRNKIMIDRYSEELESLPRGILKPKNINGKIYYYLVFRDGNKIISKYIGKDEGKITLIKEQLSRRKQIQEILKKLSKEKNQIQKMKELL